MPTKKIFTNTTIVFAALFCIALIVRVIFVVQWNATPYGEVPLLDARAYDDWAMAIRDGHFLRDRAFYQSPLYPYVLALLYWVFGHSLLIAGLFNALLGAATVVVLAAIALSYFGLEAAVVAGALAAFYKPFIFYTAPIMKEPLGLLLLALFLLFALRALKQNRTRNFVWSGLLAGLSALVRGNVLLLVPVFLVLAFVLKKPSLLKNGTVFVAALLFSIAPATLHNYIVSGDVVAINYADGFNLYIGHSPVANGINAYPPEVSTDPVQEEVNTVYIARKESGVDLGPSGVSHYWRDRAVDFIIHHPAQELTLLGNKLQAFWNADEEFDNYDIGFIEKNFSTLLGGPWVPFWLLTSLAAFACAAAPRKQRGSVVVFGMFALTYMASVLLFYVTDRYRLPVVIFLFPLAGAALPFLRERLREKNWTRLGVGGVAAVIFLYAGARPLPFAVNLTAFDWGTLTTVYNDLGRDDEALRAMNKGLAIDHDGIGSQAILRGSFIAQKRGNEEEAERLLNMALGLYPQDGVVHYNAGRYKLIHGDRKGALAELKRARELAPSYTLTYFAMAKLYDMKGDRKRATQAVQQGLAVDPFDARLQQLAYELQQR